MNGEKKCDSRLVAAFLLLVRVLQTKKVYWLLLPSRTSNIARVVRSSPVEDLSRIFNLLAARNKATNNHCEPNINEIAIIYYVACKFGNA